MTTKLPATEADSPKAPIVVGSGDLLGRWMTFDEVIDDMASSPLVERMIWDGHKNNLRPETGLVLSALEKVSLLRHSIRWAELQMRRVRHAATQNGHSLCLEACLMLRRWLAYRCGNRPNVES
jgi:hypothetical protein